MNPKKKEPNNRVEKQKTPVEAFFGFLLIFITALGIGFLGKKMLLFSSLFGMAGYWWFLVGSVFFLSFLCIFSLFTTDIKGVVIVGMGSVVGLCLGASFFPKDLFDILFLLLITLGMVWGGLSIFNEKEDTFRVRWGRVIRDGVGWYLNALAVFLVMLYMSMFNVVAERIVFPEVYVREVLDFTTPLVQKFLPGFGGAIGFGSLLEREAERRFDIYAKESLGSSIDMNSPQVKAQRQKVIRETTRELMNQWHELTGVPVEPLTPVYKVVYRSANEKLIPPAFKETPLFLVALVIIGFLIVRGFGIFVHLGVLVFGYVFLEFLIVTGIATIRFEPRSKEIISLS